MAITPNLALPYILAAQSQKHVTHNEAIRELDALVQLMVLDKDLAAPPASPAEGSRYIVAFSPTGAWAGQAGKIAAWQDGAWMFYVPKEGFAAWVADENLIYAHDGANWIALPVGGTAATFTQVGVNATPDATNKLAVASPATLFNHAGGGHQVKLNKNAAGDTASFLFQTGFSGRAEIGLTGDDDFHFKVSADGSAFSEGLKINKTTGVVTFPSGLGIPDDAVTFAKLQNISATARVLGRKSAGAGDAEECTLSDILDFIGSAAQGDILYRGASGWARLAAGVQYQVLQTQGGSANPLWASPGLTLLASGSISNAATLDITLASYASHGFRKYVIELTGLIPQTDGVSLWARLSTNGGATFDAGATDYDYQNHRWASSSSFASSTGAAQIVLATSVFAIGNGAAEGVTCDVELYHPTNAALWPGIYAKGRFISAGTPEGLCFNTVGTRHAAQDTDAIRFLFSSGNIASGTWALYGMT